MDKIREEKRKHEVNLEKSIDEAIEKLCKNIEIEQINRIKRGASSIHKEVYGIDLDEVEYFGFGKNERLIFRSANKDELTKSTDDGIFIKCNQFKDGNLFNMYGFIDLVIEDATNSINNTKESRLKSYSKCLGTSLFKYNSEESCLIMKQLITNIADIVFKITYLDNSAHNVGNEKQEIEYKTFIPFKLLTSKQKLLEIIDMYLEKELDKKRCDIQIENITFEIYNYTVDISKNKRNNMDNYSETHHGQKLKRLASYKKDNEVLTSFDYNGKSDKSTNNEIYDFSVSDKKVILLIKAMYLLKIRNIFNRDIESFIVDIIDGKHADKIKVKDEDKDGFVYLGKQYLSSNEYIEMERYNYNQLRGSQYSSPYVANVEKLFEKKIEKNIKENKDIEFVKWLRDNLRERM